MIFRYLYIERIFYNVLLIIPFNTGKVRSRIKFYIYLGVES